MRNHEDYVELLCDGTRLTLDPRRGGAIRDFQWRERAIFRPTAAADGDDPFDTACFPMVPFVNRVAGGRFSFGEHAVQLARNWSADPHPLHGHGWRVPWSLVEASESRARLQFEGAADEWPWRYRCEQIFELQQDALEVQLAVRNLSAEPMPAMLGLHPYFREAAHAQLQAQLPRVWMTDAAALPVEERPTPAAWAFDSARPVGSVPLDHCFSGWNGIASLRWPDRTVTLQASGCSHLQIYASTDRDFFCVEPQSAMSGALGRGDGAATVVAPGQRFAIRVRFDVRAT
ncbi:MAG TPA: aldose 1-epimerase [Steroidobacteraceae bacterium]